MGDRSIGELFTELARETNTLMRQEILLAKAELSQKASEAGKKVAFLAVAGAVVYAGLLAVIASIILLLAERIAPWLSALLVGSAVVIAGYVLLRQQLNALKRLDAKPRATVETLQQGKQWAKEQLR